MIEVQANHVDGSGVCCGNSGGDLENVGQWCGVSVESGDYELEAAFLTNDPTNASKTKTLSKPLCQRLCIWIWLIKALL